MEKTINFTMTESQAEKFEKILDDTLEIFKRWEKETPERDARMKKMQEETRRNIQEAEKNTQEVSSILDNWKSQWKQNNVG